MRRSSFVVGLMLVATGFTLSSLMPHHAVHASQEAERVVKEDKSAALVEEKLRVCLKVLELIDKSRKIGAPVQGYSFEMIRWSRQVLEARIYLSLAKSAFKTQDVEVYLSQAKGPANAERVTAFEQYLRSMRSLEALYRPLYQKGNFSTYDFAQIEAVRVQADIWLSREKNRE
jgi:hypothetical protein